jgi:hypothetical protein
MDAMEMSAEARKREAAAAENFSQLFGERVRNERAVETEEPPRSIDPNQAAKEIDDDNA